MKSINELEQIRKETFEEIKMRIGEKIDNNRKNILVCGGSGSGKTFFEVKTNLMQMPHNCSFIITDPKGELLRSCGQMLKDNGYIVKVINLLDMEKSDCYNPFSYISLPFTSYRYIAITMEPITSTFPRAEL